MTVTTVEINISLLLDVEGSAVGAHGCVEGCEELAAGAMVVDSLDVTIMVVVMVEVTLVVAVVVVILVTLLEVVVVVVRVVVIEVVVVFVLAGVVQRPHVNGQELLTSES